MAKVEEANRFDILDLQIKHERELRILSEASAKLALEKQAAEYERRLSDLNHAHDKALEDRAQFLEKSLYEASQKEFQTWKLSVTQDLASRATALTLEMAQRTDSIQKDAERRAAAQARSQWVWGVVLTVIALAISFGVKFS